MGNYTIKYCIAAKILPFDGRQEYFRMLSKDGETFTLESNIMLFDTKELALEKISERFEDGVLGPLFILEIVIKSKNQKS